MEDAGVDEVVTEIFLLPGEDDTRDSRERLLADEATWLTDELDFWFLCERLWEYLLNIFDNLWSGLIELVVGVLKLPANFITALKFGESAANIDNGQGFHLDFLGVVEDLPSALHGSLVDFWVATAGADVERNSNNLGLDSLTAVEN